MIFNPEKESEKVNGKTLTYSEIGKMLLTNKRIYGGFRKKISSTFNDHCKTSNDNMFSKNYKNLKRPSLPKPKDNPSINLTVTPNLNPLFGGSETISVFVPKSPPEPSIDLLQAYDRQYTLPSDRHIQPHRKYARNDSFTIAHS